MKQGLTIGMMLWNEAETLARVLASYRNIADSFILGVDRKSNDGTQEIAMEWADDYFEFDFENDFSKIRNQVLAKCNTRWFFQVDGHEFLNDQSIPFINELKRDNEEAELINVALTIWAVEEPLFLFMVPRIFRTDRNIIYERKIHNTLTCSPGGQDAYIGLKVKNDVGIALDHIQPSNRLIQRHNQRQEISIPNIEAMIAENNEAYDWFNLAILFLSKGEYEKAGRGFEIAFQNCSREDIRYQIRLHLAEIFMVENRIEKAQEQLCMATANNPLRCEHLVELGRLMEKKEETDKAIRFYELACKFPIPTSYLTLYLPYYSYFPYMKLFEIYSKQGRLIDAKRVGIELKNYKFFPYMDQLESYLQKIENVINSNIDKEVGIEWADNIISTMAN